MSPYARRSFRQTVLESKTESIEQRKAQVAGKQFAPGVSCVWAAGTLAATSRKPAGLEVGVVGKLYDLRVKCRRSECSYVPRSRRNFDQRPDLSALAAKRSDRDPV